MLQGLDDSLLERIFCKLPPSALSTAQLVCTRWSDVIDHAALWQRHAHDLLLLAGALPAQASAADPHSRAAPARRSWSGSTQAAGVTTAAAATARDRRLPSWRQACLDRAASDKWCHGRMLVAATLYGHTGPVTCLDTLHNLAITGSRDGTARVWDLARGVPKHVLHMPGAQPVVAVALPSVNLAVTAVAGTGATSAAGRSSSGGGASSGGAVLWRGGRAVRRFEATPVGSVTALALTDTQLLLGSSGGSLQHFDLFSGRQQLITRHSSGVTCLVPMRQEQQQIGTSPSAAATQQQQQPPAAAPPPPQQQQQPVQPASSSYFDTADDFHILVGCQDGQVSCISSSTGQLLWQLPTRFPSRVIAMHLQGHELQQPPGQQHTRPGQQRLFVLNARSQCICWQLLGQQAAMAKVQPGGGSGSRAHRKVDSSSGGGSDAQQVSRVLQRLWPLSVCNVGTAPLAAPASAPLPASAATTGGGGGGVRQQHPGSSLQLPWQGIRSPGATSLAVPWLGSNCLLVGSSLGHIAVLQLRKQASTVADGTAATQASAADGPLLQPLAATAAGDAGNGAASAAGSTEARQAEIGADAASVGAAQTQQLPVAEQDGGAPSAAGHVSFQLQQQRHQGGHDCHQQHQTAAVPAPAVPAAAMPVALNNGAGSTELQVVREYSLLKLGKLLASRTAAAAVANAGTSHAPQGVAQPAAVQPYDGAKVLCITLTATGQLLAGLASGHVVTLKFKHGSASVWVC